MITRWALVVCLVLAACLCQAQEKARVFITDSKSWEMAGAAGGSRGFGAAVAGGARPQTGEIIKTFGERCPDVVVNNRADKADYVVLLDHEGAKGWARKDNKVAVFNSDGDAIVSKSTRSLGNAVKDACDAIAKDWSGKSSTRQVRNESPQTSAAESVASKTKVRISSEPDGAEIELDGNFVGNAPSELQLDPGQYLIRVQMQGYRPWEKQLKVSGGAVTLKANLDKAE